MTIYRHRLPSPAITVLMPAFNADRFIQQSVNSVLSQTFEDFELLVIDDASTDKTATILDGIRDSRLHVLRNASNLGIVGSLNRGITEARGRLVARTDADDICRPNRFARQVAFLDQNPAVLIAGAGMANMERGQIGPSRRTAERDPAIMRWLLHLSNPVGHPSMMFRTEVVERLGGYLRREFEDAEDFDFCHRVLRHGEVAVMPETLMLYRLHTQNITRVRQAQVIARASTVLCGVYRELIGRPAEQEGALVASHLLAGVPVPNSTVLRRLGATMDVLLDAFLGKYALNTDQRAQCEQHSARIWWGAIQTALRSGRAFDVATAWSCFSRAELARPALHRLGCSALSGLFPAKKIITHQLERLKHARMSVEVTPRSFSTNRIHFNAVPPVSDDPPNLTIVVDTEAQFNWDLPFDRSSIAVSAMAAQEQAQVIYDAYGLRPIYVVDYAVASQAEGYEPLRDILQRHSCVIGAHLHPWINPPIEESINDYNSYGGNLPPELEAAKLHALVSAIQSGLGVRPLYFKAGRYGLGPHTLTTIAQLGFEVDFSILPLADFRKRGGGADFRRAGLSLYQPDFAGIWGYQSDRMGGYRYRPELNSIISIPMTRAQIGLLAPLPPLVNNILGSSPSKRLRLPSILSRLGLVKTVTLTPEGVTAEEQIAMLRVLVTRGYRSFVLHYHSPSLVPGYTPYVRTQNDLAIFMKRIEMVCRYFFVELGGLPKHPADFLSNASRNQIWPAPVVTA